MRDPETGGPHTAHTTNPVPVVLFGAGNRLLLAEGRLADIAPTLLELMGLPKPRGNDRRVAAGVGELPSSVMAGRCSAPSAPKQTHQ